MTCHDVQQHMYRFLDGTLDDVTHDAMQQHLGSCTRCRAEVKGVQTIKDGRRLAYHDAPVPASLWPHDRTDVTPGVPSRCPAQQCWRMVAWRWWAVAVAASLLTLGVVVLRPAVQRLPWSLEARVLSAPVQDLHTFVLSQRRLDVTSADPQQVRQWLQQKVDFAPPVPPARTGTARLVGGRLSYFLERRVAAFMYAAHGHYLALYVMPRRGLRIPAGSGTTVAARRVAVHRVRGYTHLIWSQTDVLYALVSDLPQTLLFEAAQALMRTEPFACG